MKRTLMAMALSAVMGLAFADSTSSEQEISGELVSIDGATYLIKDMSGTEHKLHVDETTKREGDIAVGAKVDAYVKGSHVTKLSLDK